MMKFECKDMGMDCDYVATATTWQGVIELASAHAVERHIDMLTGLSPEQASALSAKLETVIKAEDDAEEMDDEEIDGVKGEDVEVVDDEIIEERVTGGETTAEDEDEAEVQPTNENSAAV